MRYNRQISLFCRKRITLGVIKGSELFALPAPPFVFGTGIDTNSTLTPTDSHQAHGRLAFLIVKERSSSRAWFLCAKNHDRALRQSTGNALVEPDGIEPTTPCLHTRIQKPGDRIQIRPVLVELDGIEPTASCLQSRRSPN